MVEVLTTPAKILQLLRKGMPTPSTGQTLICKTAEANNAAWETLHTVTAGKTFYLMGIAIMFSEDAFTWWKLSFDGGATNHIVFAPREGPAGFGNTFDFYTTGWPIAQVAEGQTIAALAQATTNVRFITIWGWEE